MDNSILNEKINIITTDFTPIYEQLIIHPEEYKNININNSLLEIKDDIELINNIILDKTNAVNGILAKTLIRLNNINDKIMDEKERLQDICMLCNKYTDFDKVINITKKNSYGKYNYSKGVFYCSANNYLNADIKIDDIVGNGIEGNEYVYKDYKYTKNTLDSSNRKALTDNNLYTFWEYERITASSLEEDLIHDFNVDSEEAKCTITLYSKNKMNHLQINSDNLNIKVTRIQCSNNGVDYKDTILPYISLSNKVDSYQNIGYIYGSDILYLPNCYYAKITLQSSSYTNDTIAYEKVMFKDEIFDKNEMNKTIRETTIIPSARRHLLRINDITGFYNNYVKDCYLKTNNLVSNTKIYSIGVFANLYIPEGISSDCITFILTVNEKDYNVLPVNSEGNGIKIIRFSKGKSKRIYTKFINEPIVSASLTVKIKSYKNLTPYLNNLKVLLGGEI